MGGLTRELLVQSVSNWAREMCISFSVSLLDQTLWQEKKIELLISSSFFDES